MYASTPFKSWMKINKLKLHDFRQISIEIRSLERKNVPFLKNTCGGFILIFGKTNTVM